MRRLKGQAEALERALAAERGCAHILMLAASMRGAVNGLIAEIMEDHIRHNIVDPDKEPEVGHAKGTAELIEVMRTCLR